MVNLSVKEIGIRLRKAGRLETFPLCVYGTKTVPENAVSSCKIDRCIAKSIFKLATTKNINSIYLGQETLEGCCPGGQAWFGYKPFLPQLKYFISTGTKEFRGGAAEYLLADPDIADQQLKSVGKITPLGEYTVIKKSEFTDELDIEVRSFLCFGRSEQIRNLCSLAYFHDEKGSMATIPWGPSCASFITYPADLTETIHESSIVVGPTDPTGNFWFPENYLSLGIPFDIASRMAKDLDSSFIVKRPNVAFPTKRISTTPQD
ncbi:MAG: DUF169 domain-containing protein [Promethearchaeota archaeon]